MARKIANYFYSMDRHCRDDMHAGLIVSERDYISRLMTHLMYPAGPKNSPTNPFLLCSTTTTFEEQLFGGDGLLVFRIGNEAKIGVFESKWIGDRKWDKKRVGTNRSRFSSQIEDQSHWASAFAIWEMFLISDQNNSADPYDKYGSSCVWHDIAYDTITRTCHHRLPSLKHNRKDRGVKNIKEVDFREIWNDSDAKKLLDERWRTPKGENSIKGDISIKWMIYRMLTCQKGTLHRIINRKIILESPITDSPNLFPDHIPLLDLDSRYDNSRDVQNFMKINGLNYYISVDLDSWTFPK